MQVCTVPLTTDDGTTMTELWEGAIRESGRESSLRGGRQIGIEGWKVDYMDDSVP